MARAVWVLGRPVANVKKEGFNEGWDLRDAGEAEGG